jgi:protein-disulfide isomerase
MKRYVVIGTALCTALMCVAWLATSASAASNALTKKLIDYYRRKANVPPSAQIEVKDLKASHIKGAKSGVLTVAGRDVDFLLSDDGRYAIFGQLEDLSSDPFAAVMKKISLKGAPERGPKNAKVTIVEYSDFECPFCGRGYQTIENQVLKEYGNKVRFVYKNFPLPMHPWAQEAAISAACALQQKQDAFWTLYHYYFSNQRDINPQNLKDKTLEALKNSNIDTAEFTACVSNKKTLPEVKKDMAEGQSVGVSGTPSFIINGRSLVGAQPYQSFKSVIDDELARADKK